MSSYPLGLEAHVNKRKAENTLDIAIMHILERDPHTHDVSSDQCHEINSGC